MSGDLSKNYNPIKVRGGREGRHVASGQARHIPPPGGHCLSGSWTGLATRGDGNQWRNFDGLPFKILLK